MNKAQEIAQLMKMDLNKLDEWIDNYLKDKFIRSGSNTVHVQENDSSLSEYTFRREHIMTALRMNGFHAHVVCPDRPCAYPYYVISIPPQED